ncbi:hypothetical protein ACM66B_000001 [Microbotryomycetes sp. NB124-2]
MQPAKKKGAKPRSAPALPDDERRLRPTTPKKTKSAKRNARRRRAKGKRGRRDGEDEDEDEDEDDDDDEDEDDDDGDDERRDPVAGPSHGNDAPPAHNPFYDPFYAPSLYAYPPFGHPGLVSPFVSPFSPFGPPFGTPHAPPPPSPPQQLAAVAGYPNPYGPLSMPAVYGHDLDMSYPRPQADYNRAYHYARGPPPPSRRRSTRVRPAKPRCTRTDKRGEPCDDDDDDTPSSDDSGNERDRDARGNSDRGGSEDEDGPRAVQGQAGRARGAARGAGRAAAGKRKAPDGRDRAQGGNRARDGNKDAAGAGGAAAGKRKAPDGRAQAHERAQGGNKDAVGAGGNRAAVDKDEDDKVDDDNDDDERNQEHEEDEVEHEDDEDNDDDANQHGKDKDNDEGDDANWHGGCRAALLDVFEIKIPFNVSVFGNLYLLEPDLGQFQIVKAQLGDKLQEFEVRAAQNAAPPEARGEAIANTPIVAFVTGRLGQLQEANRAFPVTWKAATQHWFLSVNLCNGSTKEVVLNVFCAVAQVDREEPVLHCGLPSHQEGSVGLLKLSKTPCDKRN